ncbi:MAG: right-handed parallel beta-helix repeat-containing protein [Phycisphaerales bacterium]|nr:right-handed parallel beta-helix repeat-containing protein [Phycisphaerales bacterium]
MRLLIASLIGTSLLLAGTASAATIHVPADYLTIQDAIDVAINGDEIVVAPGTWTGTGNNVVDFLGKSITVRSSNGPGVTVIDGQGVRRGVAFTGGETSDSVIKGFTIRNGRITDPNINDEGAGIWCATDTAATIIGCTIIDNVAWGGGGVMLRGTNTMTDCTIMNNNTPDNTSANGYAGGMYCLSNTSIVTNCEIIGNGSYWGGGAVFMYSDSQFINCTISGNSSVQGGGVYIRNQSPTLNQCNIYGNTAQSGGGAYLFLNATPIFVDTVISDNFATGFAGAVAAYQLGQAIFENCIVSYNHSAGNAGAFWIFGSTSNMVITNCRITSNSAGGIGGGLYSDMGLVTLTETLVCDNTPDQIFGPWSNGGENEVSEICMTGACCAWPDCSIITQVDCEDIAGSTWLGGGSSCDDCLSIINGACCLNEEFRGAPNCAITDPINCEDVDGDWQGSGTDCTACIPPPQPGACCLATGCILLWQDECLFIGGTWLGNDTSCDDCPDTGACCLCDGCLQTWEQECLDAGGDWLANTQCADCPATADVGPCCMASGCIMNATEQECVDNLGEWLGTNGDCVDCPQPCFGDLNGDWVVNIDDLLILLDSYGPCP